MNTLAAGDAETRVAVKMAVTVVKSHTLHIGDAAGQSGILGLLFKQAPGLT